jgi:osmotically-inducible protein OsmY
MTGKTMGQNIDDATLTASVQAKLTDDKLSNFSRINVDTDRIVVSLNGVVRTREEKARTLSQAYSQKKEVNYEYPNDIDDHSRCADKSNRGRGMCHKCL